LFAAYNYARVKNEEVLDFDTEIYDGLYEIMPVGVCQQA